MRRPFAVRASICLFLALCSVLVAKAIIVQALVIPKIAVFNGPRESAQSRQGLYVINSLESVPLSGERPTVLIYGDSSNDSVPASDVDKRYISRMLADALGADGMDVRAISAPGMGPDLYMSHFVYAAKRYPEIDVVVFPINMAWFSPLWRETDFLTFPRKVYELYAAPVPSIPAQIDLVYQGPRVRFDRGAKAVATCEGEFELEMIRNAGGRFENQDVVRARFAGYFGHRVSENDAFFRIVERLQAAAARAGIRCVFYVTPMNVAGMEASGLLSARGMLVENVARICGFLGARGIACVNLLEDLPPARFSDVVNAHVDEEGRRFIAARVADAVRGLPERRS